MHFDYHSGNYSRLLLFIIFQIKSLENPNIFNCQRKASYEGWQRDCFKTRGILFKKTDANTAKIQTLTQVLAGKDTGKP